jgi:hypothetical protein
MVELVAIRMREFTASNVGAEIGYPQGDFLV